jgi:hypothetical protein
MDVLPVLNDTLSRYANCNPEGRRLREDEMQYRVTCNAIIKRINRVLAKDDEQLRVTRGKRARSELGDYWIQDVNRNLVSASFCDLEKLARDLELLEPGEELAEAA